MFPKLLLITKFREIFSISTGIWIKVADIFRNIKKFLKYELVSIDSIKNCKEDYLKFMI